jgi:hypothetical protein
MFGSGPQMVRAFGLRRETVGSAKGDQLRASSSPSSTRPGNRLGVRLEPRFNSWPGGLPCPAVTGSAREGPFNAKKQVRYAPGGAGDFAEPSYSITGPLSHRPAHGGSPRGRQAFGGWAASKKPGRQRTRFFIACADPGTSTPRRPRPQGCCRCVERARAGGRRPSPKAHSPWRRPLRPIFSVCGSAHHRLS